MRQPPDGFLEDALVDILHFCQHDVELAEPENLWEDYFGRTSAARTQTLTIATHRLASDLKLEWLDDRAAV